MKSYLLLTTLLIPGIAHADWGLGVSVDANDGTFFVPIDITDGFRLEPFLVLQDGEATLNGLTVSETDSRLIGLGLFARRALDEKAHWYAGARAAHVETKVTGFSTEDTDGYRIEPVLGGEYFFGTQLAVGVEAFYYYSKLEGDDIEAKSHGTDTRAILRFYFK